MKKLTILTTLSILFSCSTYTSNINKIETGTTGQLIERHVVSGFVYDKDKNTISDAIVKIKLLNNIDKNLVLNPEFKTDSNGMYYFKNILDNTNIELTVSKEGYTTVSKKENINSSKYLKGAYYINFGGNDNQAYLEKSQSSEIELNEIKEESISAEISDINMSHKDKIIISLQNSSILNLENQELKKIVNKSSDELLESSISVNKDGNGFILSILGKQITTENSTKNKLSFRKITNLVISDQDIILDDNINMQRKPLSYIDEQGNGIILYQKDQSYFSKLVKNYIASEESKKIALDIKASNYIKNNKIISSIYKENNSLILKEFDLDSSKYISSKIISESNINNKIRLEKDNTFSIISKGKDSKLTLFKIDEQNNISTYNLINGIDKETIHDFYINKNGDGIILCSNSGDSYVYIYKINDFYVEKDYSIKHYNSPNSRLNDTFGFIHMIDNVGYIIWNDENILSYIKFEIK
jgi:hypothetical protein